MPVVTGITEVDKALSQFEDKTKKKYIRRALNKSIAIVEKDFKQRVPVGKDEEGNDTGVMRDSIKRKTPKGKRGDIKRAVIIDRDRLMKLYFQRYGRFPNPRAGENEPFFYPAVIELGGGGKQPLRPMRAALYGNAEQVQSEFVSQIKQAVADAGK